MFLEIDKTKARAQRVQRKAYLRECEVCRHADLSISFLRKLRRRGGGPPFTKIGKAIRYDFDKLAAWLQARERA
jgi:Helix-turn-helix domain